MSATHGRSNLLVSGVKTRRRLDAGEPDAAEGVGNVSPVTKWTAETISEELVLARIHWCPPFHQRRPKSMVVTTWAAAGVRPRPESRLQRAKDKGERRIRGGSSRQSC